MSDRLDLAAAVVVDGARAADPDGVAATVLAEELGRRCGTAPPVADAAPEGDAPLVVLGVGGDLPDEAAAALGDLPAPGPEGYRLAARAGDGRALVAIDGADRRGLLYGVGALLRRLDWGPGRAALALPLATGSIPVTPLRGMQLAYRPKTNAYDAWTPETFERYIRELALFGMNALEFIPPRSDDQARSELMRFEPLDMVVHASRCADRYGCDFWLWYPNLGDDFRSPERVERELAERREVFAALPRLDHVFIPGGDPGQLFPDELFAWSGRVAELARELHPEVKIWISGQGHWHGDPERWFAEFYRQVQQRPPWLHGIVVSTWTSPPLERQREVLPDGLALRHYPDITHCYACGWPVPDWDRAWALTCGREPTNPRPRAYREIHARTRPHVDGSVCYSEGINDDVNKFVWLGLEWDPAAPPVAILRDYARLFIDPARADDLAQAILGLERNWDGPAAINGQVERTRRQWEDLERALDERARGCYRFQLGLMRALFDAYQRARLIHETELERHALQALEGAREHGALFAIEEAERILDRARGEPVLPGVRRRLDELADALFAAIGYETTTERHGAQSWSRGAFMDDVDIPLGDAPWLGARLAELRALSDEDARLGGIEATLRRCDPGPGGHYIDFDVPLDPRVVVDGEGAPYVKPNATLLHLDPVNRERVGAVPRQWTTTLAAPAEGRLRVRFADCDPGARYRVRIAYIGMTYSAGLYPRPDPSTYASARVRCTANGREVHDFIDYRGRCAIEDAAIPDGAIGEDGVLELEWHLHRDNRGGPDIAELWLVKER